MELKNLTINEMSVIILISQIIFLWLRTINVRNVAEGNLLGAIVTGNGIAMAWMISIAIGANAMMEGHIMPIVMHLIGGTIGTYMGMRKRDRKFKKRKV